MRNSPEAIAAELRALEVAHRYRRREIGQDGCIDFCSNDYLGLRRHPQLATALADAAHRDGVGAGASHLVNGHGPEHDALERELAEFTGRERALVFSSGYMANLGVLCALADRDDLILQDRLNHASLIDAGLLARSRSFKRYAHLDANAADELLTAHASQYPRAATLLVTDGVFSMDGDLAPLPQLARSTTKHGAWLIVDDAHGIGVLGANGGGSCEHFGVSSEEVPVLIGTFGKALGTFGAFVAGNSAMIELLIQRARSYIYTTALPSPLAAATRTALRLLRSEAWRRDHLHELIAHFRSGARARGLPLADSSTPIQPLLLGAEDLALTASDRLRGLGFRVTAIRPPTVPQGSARLRITLQASHDRDTIDRLLVALEKVCRTLPETAG